MALDCAPVGGAAFWPGIIGVGAFAPIQSPSLLYSAIALHISCHVFTLYPKAASPLIHAAKPPAETGRRSDYGISGLKLYERETK